MGGFTTFSAPQSGTRDVQAEFRDDMAILEGDDSSSGQEHTHTQNDDGNDEKEIRQDLEDEETPPSEEEEEGKEEDEEESEEKPEEEEDESSKEEEEQTPVIQLRPHRPTVREINAKYPNFFKDFPDMRHMLFREGEYSSLFPTIDDAKEAANRSDDFNKFSDLVTSGKSEDFQEFLKGVAEVGNDTLTNMAANFLPALHAMNRDMYYRVTSPIAESVLRNAYRVGVQNGNENLKNAALQMALWAFGDMAFATGDKQSEPLKAEVKKDDKLEKEKQEFYQTKYNDLQTSVRSTADTRLRQEVRKGLDPNGVFNEFTTDLLVDKIMQQVGATLEHDDRHMKTMNSLWKNAHRAGFAGNWKDRILSTYLSGARAIMPAIRTAVRNSAMKDQQGRAGRRQQIAGRSADRRDIQGSGNVTGRGNREAMNRAPAPRNIDWGKTSDMDILNDRVTYRK